MVRWGKPKVLGQGLKNSKICVLKSLQGGERRVFEASLFHSMMVDGAKVILKKLWLVLLEGKILELRVEYAVDGFGIRR